MYAIRSYYALCVLPAALLLLQPDFGSCLVLFAAVGVLLFAAGLPMRSLVPPAAISYNFV